MKKIFLIILIVACASASSATTALYRISSGEVFFISVTDDMFTGWDHPNLAVITNGTYPDGTTVVKRVLGDAKIIDGTVVRNATQVEIDTFQPFSQDDFNKEKAAQALKYLQTDPEFRRIMIALADTLNEYEFIKLREWIRAFKVEVAAATSLADLKSRVAALPAMNDHTLSQLRTQIENRISKDD